MGSPASYNDRVMTRTKKKKTLEMGLDNNWGGDEGLMQPERARADRSRLLDGERPAKDRKIDLLKEKHGGRRLTEIQLLGLGDAQGSFH